MNAPALRMQRDLLEKGVRSMPGTRKPPDTSRRSECTAIPQPECRQSAASDDDTALTDEELRDLAEAEHDECFPLETVRRLLEGEHPVRVFRTYRKLTRKQLAAKAGVTAAYLSRIERGRCASSARLRAALTRVLEVDEDCLLAVE